jgi:hypothetical protein
MSSQYRIALIIGSLRRDSLNRKIDRESNEPRQEGKDRNSLKYDLTGSTSEVCISRRR